MGALKNKLYNSLVRKNGRVWYEYERYVREHIEEHKIHRLKHLFVLLKLNWFYRVKKGNTPYMYWDVPLNPNENNSVKKNTVKASTSNVVKKKQSNVYACESRKYPVTQSVHFAKEFAQYEYVIFGIFGTLLYYTLNDKKNFYDLVGKKLQVPNYRIIREKIEQEVDFSRKHNRVNKVKSLSDLYRLMNNYIDIDVEKCVEIENALLKKCIRSNPYVKEIFEMVSYNSCKIILVDDSIYSSEVIEEILNENGFMNYYELLISHEGDQKRSDEIAFNYIKKQFPDSKILIYDANKMRIKSASEILQCKTWQYRDALQINNTVYSNKMTSFAGDIYRSLIAQHMYYGHYVDTLQYEVGYTYFGIWVTGYILWLKKQIEENHIDKLFFLESTSDFLQNCYKHLCVDSDVDKETLWITQTTAIKVLTLKHPIYFFSYFVDQYLGIDRSVAFFLEKMDLLCLADEITKVGLRLDENINKNSQLYRFFIDFIEDKFEIIKNKYTKDIEATVEYLKSLNLKNRNIAIASATGDGTIAMALDIILNDQLDMKCKIIEYSGIQNQKRTDLLSDKWGCAFINDMNASGSNVIGNEFLLSRMRNVIANIAPIFNKLQWSMDDELEFLFHGACPWVYEKLTMNQAGIFDFLKEYVDILESYEELDVSISAQDVVVVMEKLLEKPAEYLKNGVVYVRS